MEVHKVSIDVAEAEFDRMAEHLTWETDTRLMTAEEEEQFNNGAARLKRAIVRGYLTVTAEGSPVYRPRGLKDREGNPLEMRLRITGGELLATDKVKGDRAIERTNALIAKMFDLDKSTVARLQAPDQLNLGAIVGFFLA